MKVKNHVFLSPLAGGVAFLVTTDWICASVAIVSSVLIDADHALDRLIEERRFVSISEVIKTYESDQAGKVYFVFHSIELLVVVLLMVGADNLIGAVVIGFLFHISCDIYEWAWKRRKVSPLMYFFFYRMYYSFEYRRLVASG